MRSAAGKRLGLAIQTGGHTLLAKEAFDQEHGLGRKRSYPQRTRQGKLTLVRNLQDIHATGLGMVDREGETALPIVHSIIGTALVLCVRHGLGKTPNFPLQILSHPGGMQTWMMLGDTGNHDFGANYSEFLCL